MMLSTLLCNASAEVSPLLELIPQLEDDMAAQNFLQTSFWTTTNIILLLLLALGLALAAFFIHRRFFKAPAPAAASVDSLALLALDKLEASAPAPRELSLQLSLILREYLTQETLEPTLYETHQEFSSRLNSLAGVPTAFQFDMRNLLDELSEMKYAPTQQSLQGNPIPRARQLIQGIAQEKRRLEEESKAQS